MQFFGAHTAQVKIARDWCVYSLLFFVYLLCLLRPLCVALGHLRCIVARCGE